MPRSAVHGDTGLSMQRLMIILVVLGAAGVIWWSQHRDAAPPAWQGYAEADYVKVAPVLQGMLTEVSVARGDSVAAGAPLFKQDATAELAQRDQAQRQLGQAQQQLANLQAAMKPTEIRQAEANLADAQATLVRCDADLKRGETLLKDGYTTQQSVDQLRNAFRSAEAKVAQMTAALAQSQGPLGRDTEIKGQSAAVDAARAALDMADWRLAQRSVAAPVAGRVADVMARPGETMAAGTPVVSLAAAAGEYLRPLLRAGGRARANPPRRCRALRLRRPRRRSHRHGLVHRAAGRVHATRHLQRILAREAGLPHRGTSASRAGGAAQPGSAGGSAAVRGWRRRGRWCGFGRQVVREVGAGVGADAPVIDVRGLKKSYGARKVVDGLDLSVGAGEICGFLAPMAAARRRRSGCSAAS